MLNSHILSHGLQLVLCIVDVTFACTVHPDHSVKGSLEHMGGPNCTGVRRTCQPEILLLQAETAALHGMAVPVTLAVTCA